MSLYVVTFGLLIYLVRTFLSLLSSLFPRFLSLRLICLCFCLINDVATVRPRAAAVRAAAGRGEEARTQATAAHE